MPRFSIIGYAGECKAIQINCTLGFAMGKSTEYQWEMGTQIAQDLGKVQAFNNAEGNLKAPLYNTTLSLLNKLPSLLSWSRSEGTGGCKWLPARRQRPCTETTCKQQKQTIFTNQTWPLRTVPTSRARRRPRSCKLGLQPLCPGCSCTAASRLGVTPTHITLPTAVQWGETKSDGMVPWGEETLTLDVHTGGITPSCPYAGPLIWWQRWMCQIYCLSHDPPWYLWLFQHSVGGIS